MSNLKAALAGMKSNFSDSQKVYEQFFEKLPPATYDALLLQCYLKLNEESGNVRLNRTWVILSGEHEGKKCYDGMQVSGETGPAFVRRFIEQCEYVFNQEDPEELESTCEAITAEQLCFKVKCVHTSKDGVDYVNINVLQQIPNPNGEGSTAGEGEGEAPAAEGDAADDLDAQTQSLFDFCSMQGLEGVEEGADLDTLKGIMMGYTFDPAELDQTEIDLITAVGLESRIVSPEPEPEPEPAPVVKAAPKAAPAKAPAKAPAPAPAKAAPAKAAPAPAKAAPAKAPAKAAPAPAKKGPQKAR